LLRNFSHDERRNAIAGRIALAQMKTQPQSEFASALLGLLKRLCQRRGSRAIRPSIAANKGTLSQKPSQPARSGAWPAEPEAI
jgi:hypothetical protein